jgi:hypothetical protein
MTAITIFVIIMVIAGIVGVFFATDPFDGYSLENPADRNSTLTLRVLNETSPSSSINSNSTIIKIIEMIWFIITGREGNLTTISEVSGNTTNGPVNITVVEN